MIGIFMGFKYLGSDFHCKEESELSVRLQRMKFLLQLNEPSWCKVNILQHHPSTGS